MINSKRQSMAGSGVWLRGVTPPAGLGLSVGDVVTASSTNDVFNAISHSYLPAHIVGINSAGQIKAVRYAMKVDEGDLEDEIAFDLWDKACIGSFWMACAAGGGEAMAKQIVGGRTATFMNKLLLNAGVPAYERHMVLAAIYYRFKNTTRYNAQKAQAAANQKAYVKGQAYAIKLKADTAQAAADKLKEEADKSAEHTASLDAALAEAKKKADAAKKQAEEEAAAFIAQKEAEKAAAAKAAADAKKKDEKVGSWAWAGVVGLGLFYLIARTKK